MKMKLLLLIVDEIVWLCFDWCYVMLLMINYALGIVVCEVTIKLLLIWWVLKKMSH